MLLPLPAESQTFREISILVWRFAGLDEVLKLHRPAVLSIFLFQQISSFFGS